MRITKCRVTHQLLARLFDVLSVFAHKKTASEEAVLMIIINGRNLLFRLLLVLLRLSLNSLLSEILDCLACLDGILEVIGCIVDISLPY